MYCEKCGRFLEDNDRFCSGCGKVNPDFPEQYADPSVNQFGEYQYQNQNYKTAEPENYQNFQTAQPDENANVGFYNNNYAAPVNGPEVSNKSRSNKKTALTALILAVVFVLISAFMFFTFGFISSVAENNKHNNRETPVNQNIVVKVDEEENYYFSPDNKIEQQVLMENDDVKITANKLSVFGSFTQSIELEIEIENKSSQDLVVRTDGMSVNDCMVNPVFYADIPAGKKKVDSITIFCSELEKYGIQNINELETRFILNNDYSENIVIKTLNKKKDEISDVGYNLYDSEGVKINYVDAGEDKYGLYYNILIENNTENYVNFDALDTSVNECIIDSYSTGTSIYSGKKSIFSIPVGNEDLEKYNLDADDIENFEFQIEGYVNDGRYDKIFESGNINIEVD